MQNFIALKEELFKSMNNIEGFMEAQQLQQIAANLFNGVRRCDDPKNACHSDHQIKDESLYLDLICKALSYIYMTGYGMHYSDFEILEKYISIDSAKDALIAYFRTIRILNIFNEDEYEVKRICEKNFISPGLIRDFQKPIAKRLSDLTKVYDNELIFIALFGSDDGKFIRDITGIIKKNSITG